VRPTGRDPAPGAAELGLSWTGRSRRDCLADSPSILYPAVLGISSGVSRAASSSNAAATPIAAVSPTWISGPEMADPSGVPAKFSDIETANARPYQAGSLRRCRVEKRAV